MVDSNIEFTWRTSLVSQEPKRRQVARTWLLLMGCVCLGGISGLSVRAGTLEGTVHYLAPAPLPKVIQVVKDQGHCGTEVRVPTIHTHDAHGALSHAIVSVEGMKKTLDAGKTERQVLNMRCAFTPRILTARKGQTIEVRNQDPILHNTHIKHGKRTFLNVAQIPSGKPIVKRLKRHGLHSIRCDKHVFMEAYLYVFPHSYYALTNQTGTFRIADIPPGSHPVRVWHETLGVLEKMVKVPKKGTIRVDFSYP